MGKVRGEGLDGHAHAASKQLNNGFWMVCLMAVTSVPWLSFTLTLLVWWWWWGAANPSLLLFLLRCECNYM